MADQTTTPTPTATPTETPFRESFNARDVFYLIFRHKWKMVAGILLGVLAAGGVYYITPVTYRSEAALLVRYVSESSVVDPSMTGEQVVRPGRGGENVINSEIAILTSSDLLEKVLDQIGFARIMPSSSNQTDRARVAAAVRANLDVTVPKNSNIIGVSYDGPDPVTAQDLLARLIEGYLQKHAQIHRDAGAYEALSRETDQLRTRLNDLEEELRKLKYAEGVISLEETKRSISLRLEELKKGIGESEALLAAARARANVMGALAFEDVRKNVFQRIDGFKKAIGESETLLAAARARAKVMGSLTPSESPAPTSGARVVSSVADASTSLLRERLQRLRQREQGLLMAYTPESLPVAAVRLEIAQLDALLSGRRSVVASNSVLANVLVPDGEDVARHPGDTNRAPLFVELPERRLAVMEEEAAVAALEARIKAQHELLAQALEEARKLERLEARPESAATNRSPDGTESLERRVTGVEEAATVAALEARIQAMRSSFTNVVEEARRLDAIEAKIVQSQRSKELLEGNYKYACQRLERARFDEALNSGRISNISVVQAATLPVKRERLNLPGNMGIALLMGLALGVGLAVVQEYFLDRTLKRPSEVFSVFHPPLLMSLPWVPEYPGVLHLNSHKSLLDPESREVLGGGSPPSSPGAPTDMKEYFDALRDRLVASMGIVPRAPHVRVIGVAGCVDRSGTSTVAVGLAQAFARDGDHPIMLVRADTDAPVPEVMGVYPVTSTEDEQEQSHTAPETGGEDGSYKPSISLPAVILEGSYASRFARLIGYCRAHRRGVIVVDLPPISETSLSIRVGRQIDGVLLVIGAGEVDREIAEQSRALLQHAGIKVVGTVFNKSREYIPAWLRARC